MTMNSNGPEMVETPRVREASAVAADATVAHASDIAQRGRKTLDLTGESFGLLTVIAYAGHSSAHRVMWDCACECGEKVTVRVDHLRDGGTQSCGCRVKRRMATLNRTHGKSNTPLYRVWRGMIQRCEDANSPHFQYYGGRGITVCAEWRNSFEAFERDMASGYRAGLSIDRVDNDRGYSASNCRWATDTQQSRNRRFNRLLTFEGETHCVTEWAELIGIKSTTLSERLRRGWPVERALTQDVLQPKAKRGAA
jgi:hypothetical protein